MRSRSELIEFQQLTAAAIEQENEYFQEREQDCYSSGA
jgi:hypothetical protein